MKVAVCLRGAVSKVERHFYTQGELYLPGHYVNYRACHQSIVNHIVNTNPEYEFDFFIHCWNLDLEQDLCALYSPKKSLFEDNAQYNELFNSIINDPTLFTGASFSFSMKKSIELMEQYVQETGTKYDKVIIYRPDVLIYKDLKLEIYEDDKVYSNNVNEINKRAGMSAGQGDFHFVMNYNLSLSFKKLFDHITNGNPVRHHFWIKNYVTNFMHQIMYEDEINAGFHQEVLRKIGAVVKDGRVKAEDLFRYGLSKEEILKYIVH